MVALGDPSDDLPALGAARAYANNDMWFEHFKKMVRSAGCIVFVFGQTPGLNRELKYLFENVDPHKVFAIFGGALALRASCDEPFIAPREAEPGDMFGFDREWKARLVGRRLRTADDFALFGDCRAA